MTKALHHMAATPEKITLKGKQYEIHPLGVAAFARMEKWLADSPLRRLRAQLQDNSDLVSQEIQDKLVYEAIKDGSRITLASQDGQDALKSLEGVRFILWLALLGGEPDLKEEDVFDLVDISNMKTVADAMDRVSGLSDVTSGESSAEMPEAPEKTSTGDGSTDT